MAADTYSWVVGCSILRRKRRFSHFVINPWQFFSVIHRLFPLIIKSIFQLLNFSPEVIYDIFVLANMKSYKFLVCQSFCFYILRSLLFIYISTCLHTSKCLSFLQTDCLKDSRLRSWLFCNFHPENLSKVESVWSLDRVQRSLSCFYLLMRWCSLLMPIKSGLFWLLPSIWCLGSRWLFHAKSLPNQSVIISLKSFQRLYFLFCWLYLR